MSDGKTLIVERNGLAVVEVPRFRLRVTAGPDRGAAADSADGRLGVGTSENAELRLTDETVSRFHVELAATADGIVVRDLGSTNGTFVGSVRIHEGVVRPPVELALGRSKAALELDAERAEVETTRETSYGRLIGGSPAMRAAYAALARAAPTNAPVLITGESGTGKELAAHAVHEASPRASGPFEVVDCGGVTATLIESELFGHERGAFTTALRQRAGAFERADGGTLFLDELGELPLEVQPKLLRALGEGEVRRVGGAGARKVDVRVIAATNRDLRREVNAGRFRADLFYRLAVLQVTLPPLRERLEDLPALVRALLDTITRERGLDVHVEPDAALLDPMKRHRWPGNVRELRNYLEQLLILQVPPDLTASPHDDDGDVASGLEELPVRAAKSELLQRFEKRYVTRLLERTGGNVAEAARQAGVDRGTLFRTLRRHGLKRDGG